MKRFANTLFVSLTAATLFACSSSDGVGINVRAVSQSPGSDLSLQDEGGAAFKLSSALVHVRHVELDLPEGTACADLEADLAGGAECQAAEARIHIEGPFVVDLVKATSTPSLENVVIPSGVYKRIDFRVDDGDPQEGVIEAGSPLDDYSFVVDAQFDYEGKTASLNLSLNFDEDIRIERLDGVAAEAGDNLIAKFVVNDWLAGADIAGCLAGGEIALDANDVVTIDDNSDGACGGIEDLVKNNMKNSGDLE